MIIIIIIINSIGIYQRPSLSAQVPIMKPAQRHKRNTKADRIHKDKTLNRQNKTIMVGKKGNIKEELGQKPHNPKKPQILNNNNNNNNKFNWYLSTFQLISTSSNYEASTKTQTQHKSRKNSQRQNTKQIEQENYGRKKRQYKRGTGAKTLNP